MQAKEELLEQLGESYGYINRLVEKKIEYFKLNLAETSATTISGIVTGVVLAVVGLITLIFLLITLGFALTLAFESFVYGFGAVALLLLVVLLLVLVLKDTLITNPVVSKVISKFFEHDGKEV
ncbi:putative superfamily III holin-X [Neolewinella xylanilytica]|uniref:Putative superfamily III holin-X n=1 Tax=Neolewinella xylanilytica TaxID=1514080 RepID=A0A2S6I7W9_9BACT|nr:phage holin family protein [Neolewinella xylanilytica]PPK87559.1 putative superfamily III holin-X [Neolewinella xylanilytica]